MLSRLKPRTYYDLVVQVAIVRPGPIQGDMVHPYLRRREGREPVVFPKPELEKVLGKTLGVPLFQEQAMRVAIECAGFTPGEADMLRKSMATFKFTGGVSRFKDKLIEGMVERGYDRDFAEKTFSQLEGFGSYGFPESHAASFALIAYASAWLKCWHPDVFCAALLNSQPMGFYAPAQIVRDAIEHGVEVRPVCVNASRWDCTLEEMDDGRFAVRLGMRMVKGLANGHAARIAAVRGDESFSSIDDMWRRAGVPSHVLEQLAEADAFRHSFGMSRREALWAIKGLRDEPLPLFAAASAREQETVPEQVEPATMLRRMSDGSEVGSDYGHTGLSLRQHPVSFLRTDLTRRLIVTCLETMRARRPLAGGCRTRPRPAAAGQRQGRHVHHDRGRDWNREPRGVAEDVREVPTRGPRFDNVRGAWTHPARGRSRASRRPPPDGHVGSAGGDWKARRTVPPPARPRRRVPSRESYARPSRRCQAEGHLHSGPAHRSAAGPRKELPLVRWRRLLANAGCEASLADHVQPL